MCCLQIITQTKKNKESRHETPRHTFLDERKFTDREGDFIKFGSDEDSEEEEKWESDSEGDNQNKRKINRKIDR